MVGVGERPDERVGEHDAPHGVIASRCSIISPIGRSTSAGPRHVVTDVAPHRVAIVQRLGQRREDPLGDLCGHAVQRRPRVGVGAEGRGRRHQIGGVDQHATVAAWRVRRDVPPLQVTSSPSSSMMRAGSRLTRYEYVETLASWSAKIRSDLAAPDRAPPPARARRRTDPPPRGRRRMPNRCARRRSRRRRTPRPTAPPPRRRYARLAAIAAIAAEPAADDRRDVPWWREAVIYEVYVRSFADADGDGLGDLAGIRRRLPYLRRLGVDAVWLTPFYPSPQADAGYDVADYRDVDPRFGTLADMDASARRRPRPRAAGDRRPRPQPHQRRAPVVPRGARRGAGQPRARHATCSATVADRTATTRRTTGRARSAARPGPG